MEKDILKETELEKIAGGIDKDRKRENNCCPKCTLPVRIHTDAMVEGRGTKPIFTCESCRLRWIARYFYNDARIEHEMISYDAVNGVHQNLGNYR